MTSGIVTNVLRWGVGVQGKNRWRFVAVGFVFPFIFGEGYVSKGGYVTRIKWTKMRNLG